MPYLANRDSILEALQTHPEQAGKLWIEAGHQRVFDDLVQEAKKAGVTFRVIPREEFVRRFKEARHHVCLEREDFSYADPDGVLAALSAANEPLITVFDAVFDPQNLGNIVRTAACVGVDVLALPKDRSCGVTDVVSNVARGGTEHVRVTRVTNVARYLDQLKDRNIFCYGLDERGNKEIWNVDLTGPVCLVFGSEEGLRRLTRERCDEVVRIPTNPAFPTLNVATSFAIAVYEVLRQRTAKRRSR